MKCIEKIKLHNFRRFPDLEIELRPDLNILVGENESGKSSILQGINLVLSASISQVENVGVERLLNSSAVEEFMNGQRDYSDLPVMFVELYLNQDDEFRVSGKNNSGNRECHGLRMECKPDPDLSETISELLAQEHCVFPFDYYQISFTTFAGEAFNRHRQFVNHLLIDTSLVSTDYATRDYIARMYQSASTATERNLHQYEYRKVKEGYKASVLKDINEKADTYKFGLRTDSKSNLATDLTLMSGNVGIESMGKGIQCFIKTSFALRKADAGQRALDVVLLEEPENHLSHVRMRQLISEIDEATDKQLIVATHSNMIAARLDLRKVILLHASSTKTAKLSDLSEETAKFFIKAPNQGVLDFILSSKSILVEGGAEYILLERLFEASTGHSLESASVHVLSVDGLSFKRYMELAGILGNKTAVLRDNDEDIENNCGTRYESHVSDTIKVFADADNARSTFEICIYQDNRSICDALFQSARRTLDVQDYMLGNKTDAAFALLNTEEELQVPEYIRNASAWLIG